MKTEKKIIDINTISLILWIITGVIALVFNAFYIAFYCCCIVLTLNIIYYLHAYKVRYKDQKQQQLEALLCLRTQLLYAITLITLLYVLSFCWKNYKSPIEDIFIIVLGLLLIASFLSLTICIWIIKKTKSKLAYDTLD